MKNTIKIFTRVVLLIVPVLLTGLAGAEDRLSVYTVNYPLQYFAQRIAGEHADVVFPAPPGVDPAFWTPDANTVGAYQAADLVLLNGANYAKWVNRASLSRKRLVNTSAAFADDYIHVDSGKTHSHGAGAEHSHGGTAFTTWLDMQQAIRQADAIKRALVEKRPQFKQVFHDNFEKLASDLKSLDNEIQRIVSADRERAILASHPVYQYLARRYGMNLHSVTWEPDVMPAQSQWKELRSLSEKTSAGWLIWEVEPLAESVARLEQIGIRSLVFSPAANVPESGDFLEVMNKNVAALNRLYGPAE